MKLKIEKYPLLKQQIRKRALTNDLLRVQLYNKLATSDFSIDQIYFADYRHFIEDLASAQEIKAYLIADTISRFLSKNADHLTKKLFPYLSEISDQTGSLLWQDWTIFFKKFTNQSGAAVILYFMNKGTTGDSGIIVKEKDNEEIQSDTYADNTAPFIGFCLLSLILPFLEFAECETKIINGTNHKKEKVNGEKYITDIPANIEIVDSSWFTTIIRTGGFEVSGHFRLQPVGLGRSGRKLIWIKDFEKHGYTRRAKLEIKQEEA